MRLVIKIELADAESDILNQYPFTQRMAEWRDTRLADLVDGQVFEADKLAYILEVEEEIRNSCEVLSKYIQAINSFEIEECVDL